MKKRFLKKSVFAFLGFTFLVAASVFTINPSNATNGSTSLNEIATLSMAQAENSDCPNGCLTSLGGCYCYGYHAYKEYCCW